MNRRQAQAFLTHAYRICCLRHTERAVLMHRPGPTLPPAGSRAPQRGDWGRAGGDWVPETYSHLESQGSGVGKPSIGSSLRTFLALVASVPTCPFPSARSYS